MKRIVLATITTLTIATAAFAERVDIGGYFSFEVPRSWSVQIDGRHVNAPGAYIVYAGQSTAAEFAVNVFVENNEPNAITYAVYASLTEADLPELARQNIPTGWTITKIRKTELNGIPVLFFNTKQNAKDVYKLSAHIYISDKHFFLQIFYPKSGSENVNTFLDSVRVQTIQTSPASWTRAASEFGSF
jgi:hypothetical protein